MDETSRIKKQDQINLIDLFVILLKRMKLIITITFAFTVLTVVVSLMLPSIYEGTARILPSQQGGSSMGAALLSQITSAVGLPGGLPGGTAAIPDLYTGMLASRTIFDAVIDRFQLMELYEVSTREDARKALSKAFEAKTDIKSGIISVRVEDKDPQRAADMANGFVEELIKLNNNLAVSDASRRRLFFEGQLATAHKALQRIEEDLKKFQETTGAIKIDSQTGAVFEAMATLRAQVAAKEIELKVMRTYATPFNRELKQTEEALDGMKEQLKKLEEGEGGSYGNTNIHTVDIPSLGTEYLRKAREFKFQEALYGIIKNQYESARLDEANDAVTIQVIDSAVKSEKRCAPRRSLMVIIVTLAAGFFTVIAAFLVEFWERASHDPENLERVVELNKYLSPIKDNRVINAVRGIFGKKSGEPG